jgi:hypothetical protein
MKRTRHLSHLLITILLVAGPFLCIAAVGRGDTSTKATAAETALLRKFALLAKQMDPSIKTSTLAGTIRIADLPLKTKNEAPLPIVFSKQDGAFYYRLGDQETINEGGVYLQVDNQAHLVAVSEQKAVYNTDQMKTFADLAGHMKDEDYKISTKYAGNMQTISFVNENHVSCKEYTITFNKATLAVRRIFMRLTDPGDPLNSKAGKIVDLHVDVWSRQSRLSSYLSPGQVVHKVKGVWKLTDSYKNYRLIKL